MWHKAFCCVHCVRRSCATGRCNFFFCVGVDGAPVWQIAVGNFLCGFRVDVVLACGFWHSCAYMNCFFFADVRFGTFRCVSVVRGSCVNTKCKIFALAAPSSHCWSLTTRHIPLSHNIPHTQTSHTSHVTHIHIHLPPTIYLSPLLSHHSSLTTQPSPFYFRHQTPLISHHSSLTTQHNSSPATTPANLLYLTPFVAHQPSQTLVILHNSSHTTHLIPFISQ